MKQKTNQHEKSFSFKQKKFHFDFFVTKNEREY